MRQFIPIIIITVASTAAMGDPYPNPVPAPLPPAHQVYPLGPDDFMTPDKAPGEELTQEGRNIRGVYVPYPKLRTWNARQLVHWTRQVGANAVIIDAKDDRGRVTFTDDLPFAKGSPHGEVKRMGELVEALHTAGIYVIARVVCFKDNLLAISRPGTAIRDRRTGGRWKDGGKLSWVDPHSQTAHEHIESVARAVQALGVDEVQLDYVRFPVEPSTRHAVFPNRDGDPERHEVIARLLARVDRALSIPLSIDVFGLSAYHPGDKDGLGQSLEHLAPYVDAISPMVYLANWPRRYWENPSPGRTHALVQGAVKHIRRRLGEGIAVRPLLQAFPWRAQNFGEAFILNQIDAAQSGGSSGYLFWNQSGNYRKVAVAWERLERSAAEP